MKDPEQEFAEELQFHIDQRIRDYIAKGMSPEAARVAATERRRGDGRCSRCHGWT